MVSVSKLREYRERLQHDRCSAIRTITDQNGESVTYRSQSEIEQAIASIDSEIAQLQRGRSSLIHLNTSKGI